MSHSFYFYIIAHFCCILQTSCDFSKFFCFDAFRLLFYSCYWLVNTFRFCAFKWCIITFFEKLVSFICILSTSWNPPCVLNLTADFDAKQSKNAHLKKCKLPHFLLSGYSVNKLRETFHPQIALALRSGLMEAIYLKSVFAVCELNTYLCLVMRYAKSQIMWHTGRKPLVVVSKSAIIAVS